MIIHNVYFWLNSCSDQDKSNFEAGLNKVLKISAIQQGYWGVPTGSERDVVDSSYDYSLNMTLNNETDLESYDSDPTHQQFIADFSPLWESVKILDSKTK